MTKSAARKPQGSTKAKRPAAGKGSAKKKPKSGAQRSKGSSKPAPKKSAKPAARSTMKGRAEVVLLPVPMPLPPWVAPKMPFLTPHLTVKDAQSAIDFYTAAFGLELDGKIHNAEGRIVQAEMRWHGARIMFAAEGEFGGNALTPRSSGTPVPVSLYLYCPDVDAMFARAEAAGAQVLARPTVRDWGDRVCQVLDPDGHRWTFATYVGVGDGATS